MRLKKYLALTVTATSLAVGGALAQTNPVSSTTQPVRDGKVIVPERPTSTDSGITTESSLRPARNERPSLPPAVLSPVERFKLEAREYIESEQTLKRKLEGANDKDRAILRERIKTLREQWSERARELRREFKERRDELADKMPDRQELFNSIRDNARQTLQDGRDRPRYDP
jgi:hypothetical protein